MNGLLNYTSSTSDAWVDKYRPAILEDTLLPQALKTKLVKYRDTETAPHLLFYGHPGTGKTTTALTLNPGCHFHFNATGLEATDLEGSEFRSTLSAQRSLGDEGTRRRVVILDEADALTERAQQALRSTVEQFASTNWFIFVVNNLGKMIPALQSRTISLSYNFLAEQEEMMPLMVERCLAILKKEQRALPKSEVRQVVTIHYPDMRAILSQLQFQST